MSKSVMNTGMRKSLRRWFPLFVLPVFVCFIISFVVPFAMGIYLSFCNFNIPRDARWTGLRNYIAAFSDKSFLVSFGNTFAFAVVSVLVINIPAFFIARALTEKFKGAALFRTVFFLPNLIGGVVLGYIWNMLFDGILRYFGSYLTADARFGFFGLVILVAWQQIGYMMLIYIAGFQTVPTDMLEAADIDGTTSSQKLFRIIIPNMTSSIFICVFLTLTNSFKMFDQNLALTGGAPIQTLSDGTQVKATELLALNIYSTYNINRNWHGAAQAKAVVFFLLVGALAAGQLILAGKADKDGGKKK